MSSLPSLYYADADFEVNAFPDRLVMDEIKMAMSAFDCTIPDNQGTYYSSPITTGPRYYTDFLVSFPSESAFEDHIGPEQFKLRKNVLIKNNIEDGVQFFERFKGLGGYGISPALFFARDFTQQHYMYLWEWVIIKKVKQVFFNMGWGYSNGCVMEMVVSLRKDIPCSTGTRLIDRRSAKDAVQAAIETLLRKGYEIEKLIQAHQLLEAL